MKKVILLTIVIVLAFSFTAAYAAGETYKIGYACNNFNDTFQTFIEKYAKDFAKENDIEYKSADGADDSLKQQDQIKAFIEDGMNAIVVVPVDPTAVQPIIDIAKEANVTLVFVNRKPVLEKDELPENVYYVGSESIDAGIFQAEFLVDLLGKDAKCGYAILMGQPSNEATGARTAGNKQVLDKYAGYTLLAEEIANWQRDQAMIKTENWITTYGDKLCAILANNDEMALGAIEALESAKIKDKVQVLGVDLIADAKVAIKEGRLQASVLQDAKGQGAGGMEVALKALKGEKPEQITMVPYVPVGQKNLKDYE